jgi:hypothetical protein
MALIEQIAVITRILGHVGLPSEVPFPVPRAVPADARLSRCPRVALVNGPRPRRGGRRPARSVFATGASPRRPCRGVAR